jgi:hypothetical protein
MLRFSRATICFVSTILGFCSVAASDQPEATIASAAAPARDRLFHKPGLIYFWALNDACEDAKIDRMIEAFAQGGVAAVCLHPRPGLLKPYGGQAWFEFIRRTVDRCAARGLDVWLYDEDPFPSGGAGGRITMEHPEYRAMAIHRIEPEAAPERKGLYCFAPGTLLWCGLVDEKTGQTVDLTPRVGLVRRKWIKLDPWNSRYYYPATPLYSCPRAWTKDPEYAVEVEKIPAGFKLLAFVAQAVRAEHWPDEPDRLNPEVTRLFLEQTHERYRAVVGERFGRQIKAIFSDEPKYDGGFPWTRDMCGAFREQFGYDLPPRLWQLFAPTTDPQSMLTRLHYRQWCGERFRSAWAEPVGRWCREHHLALVGHISPEDDPVQQVQCVSNLLPVFPHFAVPGFDLIVPAVGDHNNPLINLGVLSASSAAQQLDRPGVLSESLACSGLRFTAEQAGCILRWQLMMGVTTHVIHCAYNSTEGLRLIDALPDFGPESPLWPGMVALGHEMAKLQSTVRDARQIAPVAILWPIRSFAAQPPADFTAPSPLRDEFVRLVTMCLDCQVGIHFLDEADLWRSQLVGRELRLGKARYSTVVLAACPVVHADTLAKLRLAAQAGVRVARVGPGPEWQETKTCVEPARPDWLSGGDAATVIGQLPRLAELTPDGTDIRCTAWQRGNRTTRLLMNLRGTPAAVAVDGKRLRLAPGVIYPLGEQTADEKSTSYRPAVKVVEGGESKVRPEDCLATIVGPGVNQPDPFPGYGGFVGWVSPIRLHSGDWLVGFSAGYWHASAPTPLRYSAKTIKEYRKIGMPADIVAPTGGRAMIIRSTDEGKTWSKPATLIDTPDDDRHPAWVELPDGTLLCSMFTYSSAELGDIIKHPENAYRTGVIRSFDHGKTWEKQPIRPPSPFLADESDGPMVLLKDGSVLLTISGAPKEGGPSQATVFTSQDRGATWRLGSVIKAGHDLDEANATQLPDGRLVMMARPEGDVCWSRDQGRTWTAPETFGMRMYAPSLYVLRDGTLVCLHGCYAPGHGGLRLIFSTDGGHTWVAPARDHGFLVDHCYGYGKATELPDGSLFVTDQATGGHTPSDARNMSIRCLRVRIRTDHSGVDLLPMPNRHN